MKWLQMFTKVIVPYLTPFVKPLYLVVARKNTTVSAQMRLEAESFGKIFVFAIESPENLLYNGNTCGRAQRARKET